MIKFNNLRLTVFITGLLAAPSLHAGVTFTNIFSFNGTNGDGPAILVRAGNNKFYGITELGGPNFTGDANPDVGSIFSITYDGVFSNLFYFESTNGDYGGYLTPGADGNFYGTTDNTAFKLHPDGTMANPNLAPGLGGVHSVLYGIVQDRDGTLYGTTRFGGTLGLGTIYKINTNGVLSTPVTFNDTNGADPVTLFLGADENFYGIAQSGGDADEGTIFRMDRSGNLTNIFLFSDQYDIAPNGQTDQPDWLMQGPNGDLYGTTLLGGSNNLGTIFRVTTNGVLVWSFSFNGTNGYGGVRIMAASDGNLYGITAYGGNGYDGTEDYSGFGTIFRITPSGSFTSLVQFDGTNDANDGNIATIVQGTDGNLYGTSFGGGASGQGAIFKLTLPTCPCTNRLMLTTVIDFERTNGVEPLGQLVQGSDGMLCGATAGGGAFDQGTVFKTTLDGSLTTLASFNGTNGTFLVSTPVQAVDGNLYGATAGGGPDYDPDLTQYNTGYGTIYRLDSNGVLTTLFTFNLTNGDGPGPGGLVIGKDGALYGVTQQGGPNFTNANDGDGTIFKITTNGDFTLLVSFDGTNGVYPGGIILASDGNFYGTTRVGGIDDSNGVGTVFRMTPDGQLTTLFKFNQTNGAHPLSIIQASDGCLYGTTGGGGQYYTGDPNGYGTAYGYGTVFRITTNGDFTLIASLDFTNGAVPCGGITEVGNGIFCGIAAYGGRYGSVESFGPGQFGFVDGGTVFQVTTDGDLTAPFSFFPSTSRNLPVSPEITLGNSLIKASDGNLYGYALSPDSGCIFAIRPVQPPVLRPVMQPGQINLSWNAWAGYPYLVMYETNLIGSNWNWATTIVPQTNGPASFSDPISSDTQRFYQVILQLP
jgi:uncharacterized repeat protein (TIGR03803 family)